MYSESETDKLNTQRRGLCYFGEFDVSMFPPIKVIKIVQNTDAAYVLTC